MTGSLNFRIKDYTKEGSGVTFLTPTLTAANIADYITANTGYLDALRDALNVVLLGSIQRATLNAENRVYATATPTDVNAQRERKALVHYHDSVTGEAFVCSIPTPDNQFLIANQDVYAIQTGSVWRDVIDILEAGFVSPRGNLMVVDEIEHVGRNV